jgi:GT2 family glycosyltransferase
MLAPETRVHPGAGQAAEIGRRSMYDPGNTGASILLASVVVPTCGRSALLERCLDALVRQDIGSTAYEIIVVDDGPSEHTRQVVEGWDARTRDRGPSVRYVANHGPHGPAAARNRGWQAAQAAVIAFTDDDTVPDVGWLRQGLHALHPGVDAVWGRISMPVPAMATDYERDAQHLETAEFVTANCLCRKEVVAAIHGFDERFRLAWREDSDFYFRLLAHGARIAHAPAALVVHPVRPAPWGVSMRQQKKIAFDALLYKKHPRLYREKIRAGIRWDYYGIVASLAAAPVAAALGSPGIAAAATAIWLGMTARFCLSRLHGTVKTWRHVWEMFVTSIAIPPLAVFWRMVGAIRFRSLLL